MNPKGVIGVPAFAGMTGLVFAVALAWPVHAKTITGEQAARVTALLERCVTAVASESNDAFDGWTMERGFVPVAYLSYERWVAPEGDYRIIFGQRGDKKGRPFVCYAVRETDGTGSFLSGKKTDTHIVNWVNDLPQMRVANVPFVRHAGFANAANAEAKSACIAGQRLLLNASITNKGAARFGVETPLLEVLEC